MAQNEISLRDAQPRAYIKGVHGVRYQVKDRDLIRTGR